MRNIVILLICLLIVMSAFAQGPQTAFTPDKHIRTIGAFSEGLARTQVSGSKYGYIDTSGQLVVQSVFEEAGNFSEGLALVGQSFDDHTLYGYIDKTGKLLIPCRYEEARDFSGNRAAVNKNGTWEYIDRQGKTAMDSSFVRIDTLIDKVYGGVYNEIKPNPHSFHNGLLLVRRGNLYGYTDTTGKWIIPPVYPYARDFSDGVAMVASGIKKRDTLSGNDELARIYNSLPEGEPEYAYGVIDTTGKLLFTADVDGMGDFMNGWAPFHQEREWGMMNKAGKIVIPAQFGEQPYEISDGIFFVQVNGKAEGNRDGYIYILNTDGRTPVKVPLCDTPDHCIVDSHMRFSDGLLAVQVGNRWGFLDASGKMVITPQFEEVMDFHEGLAAAVTSEGNLVVLRNPVK
ncbi:WG repeat-containing protein [Chitinophaga flava]|uniref:WG repeat-containing protein n=1 Tax=Chitinophaga flava TaxID=2259036 RepID=A0A365XV19_9BACT|nr:WG repeat-containing protein [Chitinophaga flava]RBL89554.1 hypothetical protein DF182_23890 [Chitinophaga flava]